LDGDDPLAALHPQVRSLLRAMGDVAGASRDGAGAEAEPTPADLAAER
jgi:hypothetical protein